MKPHSIRRALWLTNLALVAAVVGVAAYFLMEVRPAVAKVTKRPSNFQPKEYTELRKEYDSMRVTAVKWTPAVPVSNEEITATVLRPDYAKRKHWIFSGPMPPPLVEETAPVDTGPPPPEGLDTIGKIKMILSDPPTTSLLFEFSTGKKSLPFGVGDFVRATSSDAGRFKITDIIEVREKVYEISYDVYGGDAKTPERSTTLVYDQSPKANDYPDFLRPADMALPGTPGAAPEPAAGSSGTADGTAGVDTAADGNGTDGGDDGGDTDNPRVIDASSKPVEQLTMDDLQVTVHRDPRNSRRRAVEFDHNTYRYFRGKNAKSIAETVKTSVAKDKATGRVIGLRITGFQKDAPADVFDVKRGDILVSINGQRVGSRSEAISIAQRLDPNKLVNVVIDRNGRQLSYKVDPRNPKTKRKIRYFENLR